MCRLIETICVKDGVAPHLADHQERMERSVFQLFGKVHAPILTEKIIIPQQFTTGWVKCRLVYQQQILEITWQHYRIRPITSIGLVAANQLDYSLKYEDRSAFDHFISEAGTDDVIIVKNGFLTDASYANIVLKKGSKWFTPSTPLLYGTQRKRLLASGQITAAPIPVSSLEEYDSLKYINAMLDIEISPEIPMDVIRRV